MAAWDPITIDVLASVLQRSFLSPYFSFFFLLLSLSGHPALPSYESCAPYFGVTVLAHLVATSSYVWRNRLWQVADGRDRQSGSWRAVVWGLLKGIGSSPGAVPWEQQAVIITGGSGGLGACLVETLAHQGVTVFVLDVAAYHSENDTVHYISCDVACPASVSQAAARVREILREEPAGPPSPTILINNAAVVDARLVVNLEPSGVQRTFGVNALSHYYLLREFLPDMLSTGLGHVVSIASVLGTVGVSQASDYCASKAAVISLHETLRYELDKRHRCPGVRTTLVCPGFIQTPLFAGVQAQPFPFLIPPLRPVDVAKPILQALDCHESRVIEMPLYASFAWLLRGAPSWLRDLAQHVSGADEALAKQ